MARCRLPHLPLRLDLRKQTLLGRSETPWGRILSNYSDPQAVARVSVCAEYEAASFYMRPGGIKSL